MEIDISNITVRKVTGSDISDMVGYRIDYLAEMQGERSQAYIEILKRDLTDYFTEGIREGSFIAVLAESEGKALSYGGMVIRKIPGDFNQSFYLEADILNMYTLPEARKMGISTRVLRSLISEARSLGISKLALHTTKAGEKMYRSNGFSDPVFPVLEQNL